MERLRIIQERGRINHSRMVYKQVLRKMKKKRNQKVRRIEYIKR
jgi:hypothetical protein